MFSYDTYIEVAFTHTTISSYHLDISCTCITIITIIILMNMNFQQYHASVHATMQPRYLMHMHNNHHIQHLSYIIITMNLNIQQIMKQSYHNHHPIATMHASVHTSTKHAMCISCKCACLLFTMHHTVPQWATLHH